MSAARKLKPYTYQRHQPEQTALYRVVQENLEGFLSLVEEECGRSLPDFVEKEFRAYLRCGILAHGFLRAKCESCSNEHLVAFSCKKRGFCPSCAGRRMSESSVHLSEEVFPDRPVRQWVMSFPIPIRLLLAMQPKIMNEVLSLVTNTISKYLCKKAGFKKSQAKTGAVTLIQRFGGSINLNVHFHQLFLDGVYELDAEGRPRAWHTTSAPLREELDQVLAQIIHQLTRLLEKRGIIQKVEEDHLQLHLDEDDALSRLQAGSVTYRFTMGPNRGKKALTLKTVIDQDHRSNVGLVANRSGFSLHAGVSIKAKERTKLEKLCRYITRPAVALERLSLNDRGQVVYRLKKPYSDGTTQIVMTPLELMERLASLVPRPRIHLTRFSGVFAPHYKYRAEIVPQPKPSEPELKVLSSADESPRRSLRKSWAQLLKRIFDIDIESCPKCGGRMKILSAIEEPSVIKKILHHLGLPATPPRIWSARGPPQSQEEGEHQHFPEY